MFKVGDKNLGLIFWGNVKFTIEKPERRQLTLARYLIVNFEYIQHNIWQ